MSSFAKGLQEAEKQREERAKKRLRNKRRKVPLRTLHKHQPRNFKGDCVL